MYALPQIRIHRMVKMRSRESQGAIVLASKTEVEERDHKGCRCCGVSSKLVWQRSLELNHWEVFFAIFGSRASSRWLRGKVVDQSDLLSLTHIWNPFFFSSSVPVARRSSDGMAWVSVSYQSSRRFVA